MAMDVVRRNPPLPKKIRRVMEMFGDVRVDDYYWLRDDSRCHPDIISYLKEENEYADHIMSDTKEFREHLFAEIKGRINEDDISAPVRKGSYYYYRRSMKGKEYIQHCRRCIASNESSASVHDVMPTGPDAPPEHVILDENVKAEEHKGFFKVSILEVSPDNKLVAYAEDTKGGEVYTVNVIDAETGIPVGNPLHNLTTLIGWVGNDALVYTTVNEFHRPFKAWLHKLGYDQYSDQCLYHEKDDMFVVDFVVSESKEYVFVSSQSKTTGFTLCLDTCQPEKGLSLLTPLKSGVATSVSHRGDHFFIIQRSDEMYNSELLVCNKNDINSTTVLLPHRESVKIQKIQLFKDHLVVHEREGGLPKIIVYNLPPIGVAIERIQGGRVIDFIDPVYSIEVQASDYSSSILRFCYSSLRTPPSIYDYDMKAGISVLKKIESVLGDFDPSNYTTERKWAVASNGTKVPISLLYRNNLVKHDGCNPLFLYGYGSYETCIDLSFMASRLSLVDRGFIFAIAHVRGGGEMGRKWYEDGKLLKKVNTFTDFIACAEYLIEKKYTSKEKLCINGRSAGGLLIGVVLNMRPDLFKAAVSSVSFLDVLTTMLDPTIPLTTSEWEEWGDPREEEYYFYMKSYSPIDNIKPQNYPNILLTTGIYDPRVLYSESAKFVAKLREMKTDDNLLLFKCELGAGHFSKSGRFEKLQDDALIYAFILKAMGMIPSSYS